MWSLPKGGAALGLGLQGLGLRPPQRTKPQAVWATPLSAQLELLACQLYAETGSVTKSSALLASTVLLLKDLSYRLPYQHTSI